jgi:hypothetical protein
MKISREGIALFHAQRQGDGQTYVTRLIVIFRNCVGKASKTTSRSEISNVIVNG